MGSQNISLFLSNLSDHLLRQRWRHIRNDKKGIRLSNIIFEEVQIIKYNKDIYLGKLPTIRLRNIEKKRWQT